MSIQILLGDYKKVLNPYMVDLIFTSPPYNIGSKSPAKTGKRNAKKGTYDPKSYRGIREYEDNLPEEEYQKQQIAFLKWCARHLNENGVIVYNHKLRRKPPPGHKQSVMIHPRDWMCRVKELVLMDRMIWDRGSTHNHCQQMLWQHTEEIYVLKKPDGRYPLLNTKDLDYRSDVWRVGKAPVNGHNAPFPEALARAVIHAWSKPGDLVMDPYAGSGTTAVAARDLGRDFVGAEILEGYWTKAVERVLS